MESIYHELFKESFIEVFYNPQTSLYYGFVNCCPAVCSGSFPFALVAARGFSVGGN